mmetsp:Transcript_8512/g.4647  ORF Transcript_8512/g.4647 Transcript_8512/m.4647 type:complete len:95 (+) Transcript_8512:2747-3031(+)
MKITKDEILHVANLARLELDDESIEKLAMQIGEVLQYVDMLNTVNTDEVESTYHAMSQANVFREDEYKSHLEKEDVLANAPKKDDKSFLVPKVI